SAVIRREQIRVRVVRSILEAKRDAAERRRGGESAVSSKPSLIVSAFDVVEFITGASSVAIAGEQRRRASRALMRELVLTIVPRMQQRSESRGGEAGSLRSRVGRECH